MIQCCNCHINTSHRKTTKLDCLQVSRPYQLILEIEQTQLTTWFRNRKNERKSNHFALYCDALNTMETKNLKIEKMLFHNVAKAACSIKGAHISMAPKRDDKRLFFVYRGERNSLTKRHVYSIPRLGACIYFLFKAVVFFTVRANMKDNG